MSTTGTLGTQILAGHGICAVPGCRREIDTHQTCCQPHWMRIPKARRERVMEALRLWLQGSITLGEYREEQVKAVEAGEW